MSQAYLCKPSRCGNAPLVAGYKRKALLCAEKAPPSPAMSPLCRVLTFGNSPEGGAEIGRKESHYPFPGPDGVSYSSSSSSPSTSSISFSSSSTVLSSAFHMSHCRASNRVSTIRYRAQGFTFFIQFCMSASRTYFSAYWSYIQSSMISLVASHWKLTARYSARSPAPL